MDEISCEEHAVKVLQIIIFNIGESAIKLSQAGMFAAAYIVSLITFLKLIKVRHFEDNLEDNYE